MGKCVDQVYFMQKWSKRQGLKIAISQQFSHVNFSMIIFSLSVGIIDMCVCVCVYIYIYIYIHILIRSALSHVNCFV